MLNCALIRESPEELGLPEPETNPDNLFGKLGEDPHPEAAGPALWPRWRGARLSGSSA